MLLAPWETKSKLAYDMRRAAARRIPADCTPDVIYYNERNNKNKFIAAVGKNGAFLHILKPLTG
jgi:hypothetical protein